MNTRSNRKRKHVEIDENKENIKMTANEKHKPKAEKVAAKVNRKSTRLQLEEQMLNEIPTKEFLINELILGTIPGWPAWPARILDITGQTIVIQFFGTGQMCVATF